jgi:3-oxoacyl-[acyl-carrier-protein] synthase I
MLGRVKAMGLASALGPLVPAAAAFRAGVALPSPAPDFENFTKGEEEAATVAVHALPAATFGFSGVGRLIALLTEALADLATREDLEALEPETGLYVALPDPRERGFTTGKDSSHEDPDELEARLEALGVRVVRGAFDALRLRWRGAPARFVHGGNAAFALALTAAGEELRNRRVRSALVCAVDSLASPATLELLGETGRLKLQETPTGITPGEAAVALLLTPAARGQGEEKEPPVFLRAVALGKDPFTPEQDKPTDARPLASCLLSALGPLAPSAKPPVLITDHDGQHHRAYEWGMLQLQLADRDKRLGACPTWVPAQSFGHTGAASGALGAALAFRALQRGHAPAPSVLVLSSSDSGERAAIHLSGEAETATPGRTR